MADFALDEWDPPALSKHMPFPPPLPIPVIGDRFSAIDTIPLALAIIQGLLGFQAFHRYDWWQPWFLVVAWAAIALWIINAAIRPQHRRLLFWIPVVIGYAKLWVYARWIWKPISVVRVEALSDTEKRRLARAH